MYTKSERCSGKFDFPSDPLNRFSNLFGSLVPSVFKVYSTVTIPHLTHEFVFYRNSCQRPIHALDTQFCRRYCGNYIENILHHYRRRAWVVFAKFFSTVHRSRENRTFSELVEIVCEEGFDVNLVILNANISEGLYVLK